MRIIITVLYIALIFRLCPMLKLLEIACPVSFLVFRQAVFSVLEVALSVLRPQDGLCTIIHRNRSSKDAVLIDGRSAGVILRELPAWGGWEVFFSPAVPVMVVEKQSL